LAVAEAVALAVTCSHHPDHSQLLAILRQLSPEEEWQDCLAKMESSLERNDPVQEFVDSLGSKNGVSGYALHAVPVALYAWCKYRADFRGALVAVLECGGDTDTVGAIAGALCGASRGPDGIPKDWLNAVADWPRSIGFMRAVAKRLAEQKKSPQPLSEVGYFWPGLVIRNLIFLGTVLLHGFRRLLPPY
jgi:ADP-ribosylglycohydrolase